MSLTFPEPMSYSLTVTESGGLTLGLTGPAGPTGPAGGVTSVAGRTGAITLVSADITNATENATPNTVVKRNANGGGVSFAESSNGSTTVSISNTGGGSAALSVSNTGGASIGLSVSTSVSSAARIVSQGGTGAIISSYSGGFHAEFGDDLLDNGGKNRSFVNMLNGAFGWFRNVNRTLTIEAAATLDASRTYIIPDATGTTVPIVPPYADLTAANAAALGAGTFFWNLALKKLQVTTA